MTDILHDSRSESRTMPAVAYGLYLLGLTHGLTIVIAVIIAYAARDSAGPRMHSHYTWLIRTFWLSVGWLVAWGAVALVGGLFSFILIGLPFLWLAVSMLGIGWIWTLVRLIVGAMHLANDEAYPRPQALLL